jgi:plasmid stabilization system protein ParE
MAYEVVWSPRAVEDVEAIALYIAADSTSYAAAVVKKIVDTTRGLNRFPFAGRVVPEFGEEFKTKLSQSRQCFMANSY